MLIGSRNLCSTHPCSPGFGWRPTMMEPGGGKVGSWGTAILMAVGKLSFFWLGTRILDSGVSGRMAASGGNINWATLGGDFCVDPVLFTLSGALWLKVSETRPSGFWDALVALNVTDESAVSGAVWFEVPGTRPGGFCDEPVTFEVAGEPTVRGEVTFKVSQTGPGSGVIWFDEFKVRSAGGGFWFEEFVGVVSWGGWAGGCTMVRVVSSCWTCDDTKYNDRLENRKIVYTFITQADKYTILDFNYLLFWSLAKNERKQKKRIKNWVNVRKGAWGTVINAEPIYICWTWFGVSVWEFWFSLLEIKSKPPGEEISFDPWDKDPSRGSKVEVTAVLNIFLDQLQFSIGVSRDHDALIGVASSFSWSLFGTWYDRPLFVDLATAIR